MCDLVYSWKCDCKSQYIGQSKRRAGIRWIEHVNSNNQNKSASSSIFKHISTCKTFQKSYETYISEPSTKNFTSQYKTKTAQSNLALQSFHSKNPPKIQYKFSKNDFALKYFDVLQTNLTHESQRRNVEQFLILLHRPSLNEQSDFKLFKTF